MNENRDQLYVRRPAQLTDQVLQAYYHVMDLPDGTTTTGFWDLRGREREYLGGAEFAGTSVLEIGPASGFLTLYMERQGAEVTAVEMPDDMVWDFVPHFNLSVDPDHLEQLRRTRDTWWHTHDMFRLKAKLVCAHPTRLPSELGPFDTAVLASVLLHARNPHDVLIACARLVNTIIIVEPRYDSLETDTPLVRLVPNAQNKDQMVWWHFSTPFFTELCGVLGFNHSRVSRHQQRDLQARRDQDYFTIVAERRSATTPRR